MHRTCYHTTTASSHGKVGQFERRVIECEILLGQEDVVAWKVDRIEPLCGRRNRHYRLRGGGREKEVVLLYKAARVPIVLQYGVNVFMKTARRDGVREMVRAVAHVVAHTQEQQGH